MESSEEFQEPVSDSNPDDKEKDQQPPPLSKSPSPVPIKSPSPVPTKSPSPVPTKSPSPVPTKSPSPASTTSPSPVPTTSPSPASTTLPSPVPIKSPPPASTTLPSPVAPKSPPPVPPKSLPPVAPKSQSPAAVSPPPKPPQAAVIMDYGDRIPPPQQIVRSVVGVKSTATDPNAPTETSTLLGGSKQQIIISSHQEEGEYTSTIPTSPPRRYVVYGDGEEYDSDEDEESMYIYGRRKPKKTKLINFWASIMALSLSLPLLGISIYEIVTSEPSSAATIIRLLGILLGSMSSVIECFHNFPSICPTVLQFKLGHHAVLHTLICCFSILPYMQHENLLGLFFVLHLIPALLFYAAKARRESIPGKH